MSHDVTEFPIWENCPWKDKVPSEYSVRVGAFSDTGPLIVILWKGPEGEILHVDASAVGFSVEHCLAPMINNLGTARWALEYPEEQCPWTEENPSIWRKEAESVVGKRMLTQREQECLKRMRELSRFDFSADVASVA